MYCSSVDYELISSSSFDEHDDHDALQHTFTVTSKASILVVFGCSGVGKSSLVNGLVETGVARVLVSYPCRTSCKTALPKICSSWGEKLAEDGWCLNYDNSEFVPLQVFQQHMKDEKYTNAKQLAVFTAPQNVQGLFETDFFTHVLLDEGAHELKKAPSCALLKIVNKTSMDGSNSCGCALSEEQVHEMNFKSDDDSSSLSDDTLTPLNSGHLSSPSPPVSSSLSPFNDLTCEMLSNVSLYYECMISL